MQMPGGPSLVFLFYLLLFLPWAAWRSAQRLRPGRGPSAGRPLPSREAVWTGVLWSQAVLFALAWLVGGTSGYQIFSIPSLGPREVLIAAGALGTFFGLRALLQASRSEEERRRAIVYVLAPRTRREHLLWGAAVLAASVAEEAAYRGVGFTILWYALGNPWVAALLSALAFALAHSVQGWKSARVVLAVALVAQGLVLLTKTLVLAMVVHALYDLAAGLAIARQARRYDEEARAGGADREEDGHDHRRTLDRLQQES